MFISSEKLAFLIPEDKKTKFADLRENILLNQNVTIKSLQRLAGKCISFFLAIPSSKLFIKEINKATSVGSRNSKCIKLTGELLEEIKHWRFLDTWSGHAPWKSEKHLQIALATDASNYKWGALVLGKQSIGEFSDFWEMGDHRPIHIKEAHALYNALLSNMDILANNSIDAYVDNLPLVHAWENQKGKDINLNRILKAIYACCENGNFDLRLHFIPSLSNPADFCSRSLSTLDAKLSSDKWKLVEDRFGPHTSDLMALDSNAMLDNEGKPLGHFTPFPTPCSAGVNVFAQDVAKEVSPYVFPPLSLILPLLKLMNEHEQHVKSCTMIVPVFLPHPIWWPLFWNRMVDWLPIGQKGEIAALLYPSKDGYIPCKSGLHWDLIAAKLKF